MGSYSLLAAYVTVASFVLIIVRKTMKKTTFALYFGNRGFFPGELIASAREEMCRALKNCGFDVEYNELDEEKCADAIASLVLGR